MSKYVRMITRVRFGKTLKCMKILDCDEVMHQVVRVGGGI